MAYTRPCNARISDSWQGHRNRRPPSTEPGTDYACAYGTRLVAAGPGRVVGTKSSNSGAMGRFVTIDLDDGRRVRYLHLSVVGVSVGNRVNAGSYIGQSGGSANGNNWGVGAHVHVTLWARHAYTFGSNATLDFERYVNGSSGGFSQDLKNQQSWLNQSRGEKLVVDGLDGPASQAAIKRYQQFLKTNYGYKDAVDGKWGANTQTAHQKYYDAWHAGTAKLVEDGELGPATIKRLQKVLGVSQDGKWGPATTLALQKKLNAIGYSLTLDSDLGPATIKALQTYLLGHTKADGQMGPETIRGLQHYLNSGGVFPPKKPTPPAPPSPVTTQIAVDGEWGAGTTTELQKRLGVTVDGDFGPATRKALQTALNAKPFDGKPGPITNKHLQTFLKLKGTYAGDVDGQVGPETIKGLQRFLNTGQKFTAVTVVEEPKPVRSKHVELTKGFYPGAYKYYDTPNGRDKRDTGSVIGSIAFHHQAGTGFIVTENNLLTVEDNPNYNYYIETNGRVYELTNPALRSKATAGNNNTTISICFQNTGGAPEWAVSNEQIEAAIKLSAYIVSFNGKTIGGFKANISLDRTGFKGHKEYAGNSTACPGPTVMGKLGYIIEAVKRLVSPPNPPVDPGTPTDPVEPPVNPTEPGTPEGYTLVKTSTLTNIQTHIKALQIVMDNLLGGKQ